MNYLYVYRCKHKHKQIKANICNTAQSKTKYREKKEQLEYRKRQPANTHRFAIFKYIAHILKQKKEGKPQCLQ